MERLHEQVSRVLAQEAVNTTAINDLRSAITSLRDVIGELGTNAAMQGQALLGIKEVFSKEVSQLREDQNDVRHAQQKVTDTNNHRDELFAQRFDGRFEKIETRVSTIENSMAGSRGYWNGSKGILGFVILALGAVGGTLLTFLIDHVKF